MGANVVGTHRLGGTVFVADMPADFEVEKIRDGFDFGPIRHHVGRGVHAEHAHARRLEEAQQCCVVRADLHYEIAGDEPQPADDVGALPLQVVHHHR